MGRFLTITGWNAKVFQRQEEEIKLFLTQNFIGTLLISETLLQTTIHLAYQDTSYATPIILMAQRTELRRQLSKEQSNCMNW
jgi:hypothetical protein